MKSKFDETKSEIANDAIHDNQHYEQTIAVSNRQRSIVVSVERQDLIPVCIRAYPFHQLRRRADQLEVLELADNRSEVAIRDIRRVQKECPFVGRSD